MGINLKPLLEVKSISFQEIYGKKLAVDAYNVIMQFLSTIRFQDGRPLQDSKGNITSHLSGLFYRNINLLKENIKPCYVFDGLNKPFKTELIEERIKRRKESEEKYKSALEEEDYEKASLYASQTASLTPEIIQESKEFLEAMGLPIVQANGEGEAMCALMAKQNLVFSAASQDYDALLYGSPFLIRNLNITGKRKLPKQKAYVTISPELINLNENLKRLDISQEQLITLALIMGTDFNPGIKGFGPKKALDLVRKYPSFERAIKEVNWDFEIPADKLFNYFMNPPENPPEKLEWGKIDEEKILKIMVDKHEFSEERIISQLNILKVEKKQTDLDKWI